MKKTMFIIMILTLFSIILGFGREIVLSYFYGVSDVSDSYIISLTIPAVLFIFIGVALKTTFMPMYSEVLKNRDEATANEFTNKIINSLIFVATLLVILVLVFTKQIVILFASGFKAETLELAIFLTRITAFAMYFIGILYILERFLQLKNMFVITALVAIPLNLTLIASIVLSTKMGVLTLGLGKVIAVLFQLIFLLPFVYAKVYRYKCIIDFKDSKVRSMLYLSLPVMLGTSVNQLNKLVDRILASQIAVGCISALNYAARLNKLVQEIFVMAISTVFFATITKMAVEDDIFKVK